MYRPGSNDIQRILMAQMQSLTEYLMLHKLPTVIWNVRRLNE